MPIERQTEQPIEQREIDDMNEAIAIFEGWELVKGDPELICPIYEGEACICSEKTDKFIRDGYRRYRHELKYHSSWEEIHKCWAKLYKQYEDGVGISNYAAFNGRFIYHMSRAMITGNITAAHRILFNAIEWINKNNEDGK